MRRPAGPYALCSITRGYRWAYIRAPIACQRLEDAVALAVQERERYPDEVFWLEAWPGWWR